MKTPDIFKIIGSPKDLATTQVHQFDLKEGTLIVLVTLSGSEPNLARMETIRGVVNFLHHTVSESQFDFETVKSDIAKNISTPPFDIAVLYLLQDNVYVFALGRTVATLFRHGEAATLLKGNEEVHASSGKLLSGDVLCVGTSAFWEVLPDTSLNEYITKGEVVNVPLDFEVSVEKSAEHEFIGGVILTYGEAPKKQEVPEEVADKEVLPLSTQNEEEVSELDEEVAVNINNVAKVEPNFFQAHSHAHRFFVRGDDTYEARGKNKKATMAGAILLMILAVCLFFGFRAKKNRDETNLVQNTIKSAQEALSQARTISLVNKGKARELIYTAKNQIASISDKEERFPEVKGMSDEISESLGDVGGIYEDAPDTFSDLSLISSSMKASDIQISDNIIRVLGSEDRKVITIELPGKKTEALVGSGTYSNPSKVIAYADRTFVWEDTGIHEYGGEKASVTPATSPDRAVIRAFAGNLYLLDKEANMIWRYGGSDSGFSEKAAWLSTGVTTDLSKTTSISIDGSIWVLSESGRLTKFTLGNPQNVTLQGIDTPLSDKAQLYTSDETSSLYILDPSQGAVYVFTKTGEFVAKYANDALKDSTNFVVSESQKVMVFATGAKLLSLDIKHIK